MGISWIEHKGKRILYEDYHNLKSDEVLKLMLESEEEYKKATTLILDLVDLRNIYVDDKMFNEAKRLNKEYSHLFKKKATVGVTGIKKILARGISKLTGGKDRFFDTIEEAKDYLCEE